MEHRGEVAIVESNGLIECQVWVPSSDRLVVLCLTDEEALNLATALVKGTERHQPYTQAHSFFAFNYVTVHERWINRPPTS